MTWVDLARDYSVLGQIEPAKHAIRVALALEPNDRFVLGAAARFFLHAQDRDQARAILRRADRTRVDPWLLAAEIATAKLQGKDSNWVSRGRQMVMSENLEPRQISELAGALGTLEHDHGNRRGVRRMFARALEEPTENAVAQASWIARHDGAIELPSDLSAIPRAYEAMAWEALERDQYKTAVSLAWKWFADEPFAMRAPLFGAWVSVVALGDYAEAERFMRVAEVANPTDPRVKAELFFCAASRDNLVEAERLLGELPAAIAAHTELSGAQPWDVMMAADKGLIAYRRGRPVEGRLLYEEAVKIANEQKLTEAGAAALIFFAREERRANTEAAKELVDLAARATQVFPEPLRPMYRLLLERPA